MKKIFKKGLSVLMSATILMSSGMMATTVSAATNSGSENYTLGDVDGNDEINVDDINKLQDYLYGDYKPSSNSLASFLKAADINEDGKVDDKDVDAFVDAFIYADSHLGNVNKDGGLSVADGSCIQKYLADMEKFDINSVLAADFNQDNEISVIDATEIQRQLIGMGKPSSFPTAAVKADDEKYRKEYAEYITPTIEAITKNCYLVWSDDPDYAIYFRDSKWLYQYIGNPGTIHPESRGLKVIGTYASDKDIILPSKTEGGVDVDGASFANGSVFDNTNAKRFYSAGDLSLIGYSSYGSGIELNSVIIPNGYIIEKDTFSQNMTLKHVFMANDVTLYGYCFQECPSLVSVKFSNTLEKIPDNAFQDCRSLDRVAIPDSVTSIKKSAFLGCALREIKLGKNVANIGKLAFLNCPLEKVYVYNSFADIGAGAFYNRSYGTNGNIDPNCKFYGYENSTLKEWLEDVKESGIMWGNTVTYDFVAL